MSLMSSSLRLQQCHTSPVHRIFNGFCDWWAYSCCFVGSSIQDFSAMIHGIIVQFPSNIFPIRFVSVQVMHPTNRIDATETYKEFRFILLGNLPMALVVTYWCHFQKRILTFRGIWTYPTISENRHLMWRCLVFIKPHILPFVCFDMEANPTCCLLQTMQLAWVVVFARSSISSA